MFSKKFVLHLALSCLIIAPAATFARAQDEEGEEVRQVFFSTRPGGASKKTSPGSGAKSSNTAGTWKGTGRTSGNTSSSRKSAGTKTHAGGTTKKTTAGGAKNTAAVNGSAPAGAFSSEAIALGYTLYLRDARGDAVRVEPGREFRSGEQIRIALETNTDGYLYVFHTEDGSAPQMLFPDVRIRRGANAVRAHVPYQVPPELDLWFKFDANPAAERLYVVVTRRPLEGVPAGDALLEFVRVQFANQLSAEQAVTSCNASPARCIWRPAPSTWERVAAAMGAPAAVSKSDDAGRPQTTGERDATVRGIGLSREEPAPSVIRLNSSANAPMIVATIDLVHK